MEADTILEDGEEKAAVETTAEEPDLNEHATHESATKTFAIPELLELILLHLDIKTLLLAQRVDTQWREAVASSKKLQKKLFFLPVDSFEEAMELNLFEGNTIVNVWGQGPPLHIVRPNPLFHDYDIGDRQTVGEHPASARSAFRLPPNIVKDMVSFRRGKSSWERMFIRQPLEKGICAKVPS